MSVIDALGRSPHGERGLKLPSAEWIYRVEGRSPHGERGLKSADIVVDNKNLVALLMESVD